jgi:prepilin peptidase CpaA
MSELPLPTLLTLAVLAMTAAIYDCRFRRIPNWLNLSGLIVGFGLNTYYLSLHGGIKAAEGMALAVAVYFPFYLLRGMGAGDVKLMAAIGSLAGPSSWFAIFLATALVGGLAAAVFSVVKGRFAETCCNVYFLAKDLLQLRTPFTTNPKLDFRHAESLRMPHGLLIAAGCVTYFAWSVARG